MSIVIVIVFFRFWRLFQIPIYQFPLHSHLSKFTIVSKYVDKCDFRKNIATKPKLLKYSSTHHFHFSLQSHFLLFFIIFTIDRKSFLATHVIVQGGPHSWQSLHHCGDNAMLVENNGLAGISYHINCLLKIKSQVFPQKLNSTFTFPCNCSCK